MMRGGIKRAGAKIVRFRLLEGFNEAVTTSEFLLTKLSRCLFHLRKGKNHCRGQRASRRGVRGLPPRTPRLPHYIPGVVTRPLTSARAPSLAGSPSPACSSSADSALSLASAVALA